MKRERNKHPLADFCPLDVIDVSGCGHCVVLGYAKCDTPYKWLVMHSNVETCKVCSIKHCLIIEFRYIKVIYRCCPHRIIEKLSTPLSPFEVKYFEKEIWYATE